VLLRFCDQLEKHCILRTTIGLLIKFAQFLPPICCQIMATIHLTLRMLRGIRLTNQKIEFYKLTNQKMLQSIRSAK